MIDTHEVFSFSNLKIDDSSNKYSAMWIVSADLPYFEGHFPNNPILPAVALLDLSEELLKTILKKQVQFKSIGSAKFLETIEPNDILTLEFTSNEDLHHWACLFKNQDEVLVCKLSFSI